MFYNKKNKNDKILFYFVGEKYTEPIVAEDLFVMNSSAEITNAYQELLGCKSNHDGDTFEILTDQMKL